MVCLVAVARANILDTLGGVVHTVEHGVVDAANTVANGVKTAANAVAGVLPDVAGALGSTFQDIWNVAKNPLEAAGKELLKDAAEFALQEGLELALDALAAGKREVPQQDILRQLLYAAATDEYTHWLADTKKQILDSRNELQVAMGRFRFRDMPKQLKNYFVDFLKAKASGNVDQFIVNQAFSFYKNAISALQHRLNDRLGTVLQDVLKN